MIFRRFLVFLLLLFAVFLIAQEDIKSPQEVYFERMDQVPIFPGCGRGKSEDDRRKCFRNKVFRHVARQFNSDLGNELGLKPGEKRIIVLLKIDKKGDITNIRAKAPHYRLEREAIRIIKKLPKMIAGKDRGLPVIVKYALPINFNVE